MNDATKNISGILKRICLAGLFFYFALLFVQQVTDFKWQKPLHGDIVPATYGRPSLHGWFSGGYQDSVTNYLNENFGFRNYFLRLNNQLRFSLFKKAQAKEVVIGKENYMYVQGYINSYFGWDYLGDQPIHDTVSNLKFLQDTLRALGKTLLVVLAPSKVRIYPEFLPDGLPETIPNSTNYSVFSHEFDMAGINHIDFNKIYKQKKNSSPYLLFPQLGVHWSRLEAVMAADTIMGKLSQLCGSALPRVKITRIIPKDNLEAPDEDIIEAMNVFKFPAYKKMGYPEFKYQTDNTERKNVLVIADSYWWDIYLRQIPRHVFNINNFWYYNRDAWGNNFVGQKNAGDEDIVRAVLQNDIIIIMSAESNLGALGFGFIGSAAHCMKRSIIPTGTEINDIKSFIRNTPEWMAQLQAKAITRHLSVDSMLTLDAIWTFRHKGPLVKRITLDDVKKSITNNPAWMAEVETKAKEKKVSLDSMVTETATWYFNSELWANEKAIKKLSLPEVKMTIRQNPDWLKQVTLKAKDRDLPLDSMITLDALWYISEQK